MDLGFISRRLSCSFIVNPSNPEKAFSPRFTFFTLQKRERVSAHSKHTQRKREKKKKLNKKKKKKPHTHSLNIPGKSSSEMSPGCRLFSRTK